MEQASRGSNLDDVNMDSDGSYGDEEEEYEDYDDNEEVVEENGAAMNNKQTEISANKQNENKKKKRKNKKAGMRRNIRNVFSETALAEQTKKMREQEQVRLRRLGLDTAAKSSAASAHPFGKQQISVIKTDAQTSAFSSVPANQSLSKKVNDVICLDSDSDEEKPPAPAKTPSSHNSAIVILSSDSESESGEEPQDNNKLQSDCYYSELGLHTNDALNVKDEEGRVLININHSELEQDLFLHPAIGNVLKPHQIGGVRFLYDNLIESMHNFKVENGTGCILAHAMGLGKTIQTVTFIDLFLRCTSSRKVLCVVPVNTIQNWMNEFNHWLPPLPNSKDSPVKKLTKAEAKILAKQNAEEKLIKSLMEDMVDFVEFKMSEMNINQFEEKQEQKQEFNTQQNVCTSNDSKKEILKNHRTFQVFMADSLKTPVGRAKVIEEWDKLGGVLLMGYEMYRSIVTDSGNRRKKKMKDGDGDIMPRLKRAICDPGPDLVVCDEGHRIRNYQSGISQALKSIKTRRRLVLTGYPLQNNLIEYWCMVDFVRPNYLGTRQEFANMFERPIMNGQCVDSTARDKHLMKQRAHVLYSLLEGFVQRRGHGVFKSILPDIEEHVMMIRLSPIQKALYKRLSELTKEAYSDSLNPIKTFCLCCKIWNHPDILFKAIQASNEGKQMDIISDEDDIALDDASKPKRKKRSAPSARSSPLLAPTDPLFLQHNIITGVGFDPFGTEAREVLTDIPKWAGPIFQEFPYTYGDVENSGKFYVLRQLLDECLEQNDKMLIFSQSLLTLNSIEEMLQKIPMKYKNSCWKKGINYYRLDGSTSSTEREKLINNFNDPKNEDTKLFLLSTRAGCLGINLVSANRVVVFDVSWNPCHDAQAVCRIYRYGQTKRCYIYRLVSSNTMEKKIYYRQISKKGISDRVVDELNLTENFSKNEIQSLVDGDWVDEPVLNFNDGISLKSTDHVLLTTLQKCAKWITKVWKDVTFHRKTARSKTLTSNFRKKGTSQDADVKNQIPFKHESLLIDESSEKLSGSEKRAAKRAYEQERQQATSSQVPYRTYPLQQNFPRNTPVVPVRPFLWRPPSQSCPNLQSAFSVGSNVTITANAANNSAILQLLQNVQNQSRIRFVSNPSNSTNPLSINNTSVINTCLASSITPTAILSVSSSASSSSLVNSIVNNARDMLSSPLLNLTQNISPSQTVPLSHPPITQSNSESLVADQTTEMGTSMANYNSSNDLATSMENYNTSNDLANLLQTSNELVFPTSDYQSNHINQPEPVNVNNVNIQHPVQGLVTTSSQKNDTPSQQLNYQMYSVTSFDDLLEENYETNNIRPDTHSMTSPTSMTSLDDIIVLDDEEES